MAFLFVIILTGTLLFEGLGIPHAHNFPLLLIALLPFPFYLQSYISKQKLHVPKISSILFLTFLCFSLLSTLFSVNVRASLEYFFYLGSAFLCFIYAYNIKDQLKKSLVPVIFFLSVFFVVYAILFRFGINFFPFTKSGYQFITQYYGHNHLGDFLILPLVICFYWIYEKINLRRSIKFIIFAAPFLIFSYSRTAYLSLFVALVSLHIFESSKPHSNVYKWTHRLLLAGIFSVLIFFFVASSGQTNKNTVSTTIHIELVKTFNLSRYKGFASRYDYFRNALYSIHDKPILGVGPSNFKYVFGMYSKRKLSNITDSSHNIFVDIATEQGIFAMILFTGMIGYIFIKSEKKELFFVALAMLCSFQTDYLHLIYSYLLLFFVILGTNVRKKSVQVAPLILFILSFLIAFAQLVAFKIIL